MGTETFYLFRTHFYECMRHHVKLNNPLMGTETVSRTYSYNF